MPSTDMTAMGLVVALVLIVAREVIVWLGNKNLQSSDVKIKLMAEQIKSLSDDANEIKTRLEHVSKETHTLYEWHDKDDQDGVKVWYIRQSLENVLRDNAKAVAAIAKNSELQTRLLEEMLESQRIVIREQSQVMREIREIQRSIDLKDK